MNKTDSCCHFVFLLIAVFLFASCERSGLEKDDGIVHVSSIGLGLSPVEDVAVTDSLFFQVQVMPENASDKSFTFFLAFSMMLSTSWYDIEHQYSGSLASTPSGDR